jgi:hypothetical protein
VGFTLGEALLKTLKAQEEPRTVSKGAAGGLGGDVVWCAINRRWVAKSVVRGSVQVHDMKMRDCPWSLSAVFFAGSKGLGGGSCSHMWSHPPQQQHSRYLHCLTTAWYSILPRKGQLNCSCCCVFSFCRHQGARWWLCSPMGRHPSSNIAFTCFASGAVTAQYTCMSQGCP